ncbi:MAG TPA: DUF1836 domain-containing protein [Clostridiales bacterium]|jgi:hypothetical protein|nr:DUF1836 domain-containing protein [Clostridiales bacterium]
MRYEEYVKILAHDYMESGIVDVDGYPDIDLYIDQMVKCLNKELRLYGDGESGPVTKSMVSNYTKYKMIPRPAGKHYTKNHLILMTIVFYLKGCFSMEEIQRLMKPVLDNYTSEWDEPIDLSSMYAEITDIIHRAEADLPERMDAQIREIKRHLTKREAADDDTSELMMLITTLIMRSNAERFIAEKLLDEYFAGVKKSTKNTKKK